MAARDVLGLFKTAGWRTDAELDAALQALGPVEPSELGVLLQTLLTRSSPSEGPVHAARWQGFAKLVARQSARELAAPMGKALRSSDPVARNALVVALASIPLGQDSAELCTLLKASDGGVRNAALTVLKTVGGRQAFEAMAAALGDKDCPGRIDILEAMAHVGGMHATPVLLHWLKSGRPAERTACARLLGDPRMAGRDPTHVLGALHACFTEPVEQLAVAAIASYCAICSEQQWFEHVAVHCNGKAIPLARAAVEGLRRFPTPRATAVLSRKLRLGPNALRLAVLDVLEFQACDSVVPVLVDALAARQLVVKTRAAEVMKKLAIERKVNLARTILWLLRSRDAEMRRMATEIVQGVPDPDGELWPHLMTFLRDHDWWVRERVMDALIGMAGQQMTRHAVTLLGDSNEAIRRYAIDILMRVKDPRSLGALIKSLNTDEDWWVREKAVEAIGQLGDPRAVPFLADVMMRCPELVHACLASLSKLDCTSVMRPLLSMLTHDEADVRKLALNCLGQVKDPAAQEHIQHMLGDKDPQVRRAAGELMMRLDVSVLIPDGGGAFEQFLRRAMALDADDLILAPNRAPTIKRMGKVEQLQDRVLDTEEVRQLIMPLLSEHQLKELNARRDVDLSYEIKGEPQRFRINVFHQQGSLSAVIRIIRGNVLELKTLGLPSVVESFTRFKDGLVLIGGATGSGKSTTLAALINQINAHQSCHIISLEDPIETVHQGRLSLVNQRELGTHTHSVARALRGALRQDPDVLVVGELRDLATIQLAISAAETGHLVFGSVHTVSADTAVDRIINAFPAGQQQQVRATLSGSLRAVLCQTLLRRSDAPGRCVASEVMINNDAVANLIRKGRCFQIPSVIATSRAEGMHAMDQDLLRLWREGKITAEDVFLKARNKKDVEAVIQAARAPQQKVA